MDRRVSTGEVNASCGEATASGGLIRVEKPKTATVRIARKNRREEERVPI